VAEGERDEREPRFNVGTEREAVNGLVVIDVEDRPACPEVVLLRRGCW